MSHATRLTQSASTAFRRTYECSRCPSCGCRGSTMDHADGPRISRATDRCIRTHMWWVRADPIDAAFLILIFKTSHVTKFNRPLG
jgi:hypothetical protein